MLDVVLTRSRWESTNPFLPSAGGLPKPAGVPAFPYASPKAAPGCGAAFSSLQWLA